MLLSRGVQRLLTLCAPWAAVLNDFTATVSTFMTDDEYYGQLSQVRRKIHLQTPHTFTLSAKLNVCFDKLSWAIQISLCGS